jgi:uncharacterized protein (AIM24 family)
VTDIGQRVECQWCHNHNALEASSCDRCGAPLDARKVVSDSGWREAPRLRDLTQVHFGASTVEVDGGVVPVAEITLDPADSVYFEHHAMLWKDATVPMSVMSTPGGARRMLGDLPFVLSVAKGPGKIALSRDAAGGLIVLPVDPGVQLEVRGHGLLAASGSLTYEFTKVPGLRTMLMAGTGMYFDRFSAAETPGVLILHGYGNLFERVLGEGESIQLEPGGFLYKDVSVGMQVMKVDIGGSSDGGGVGQGLKSAGQLAGRGFRGLKAMRELMSDGVAGAAGQLIGGGGGTALAGAFASNTSMVLMRLTGPGRVGIQSMYQHKGTD